MSDALDSNEMGRRDSVKRAAVAALALSLGIPDALRAGAGPASRFVHKFYYEDRLLDTIEIDERTTEALASRPTAVQIKWYDLKADREVPRTTLGFTDRLELKIEWQASREGELDERTRG